MMKTPVRQLTLIVVAAGLLAAFLVISNGAGPVSEAFADDYIATVHVFDKDGILVGPVAMDPVVKTAAQWHEILTDDQWS